MPHVAVTPPRVGSNRRYAGADGAVLGTHTFGASAPLKALAAKFGFLPDAIVNIAKAQNGAGAL